MHLYKNESDQCLRPTSEVLQHSDTKPLLDQLSPWAFTYLACLSFEAGNIARSSVGQFQFTAFVKTDWNNLLKGLVSMLSSSYIVFVGHVFV